jgi:hypothetical protein
MIQLIGLILLVVLGVKKSQARSARRQAAWEKRNYDGSSRPK